MKRQTALVLDALRRYPNTGLTPREARIEVGTDRLAARIAELRAEGFDISTTYVTDNSGSTARFARYHIHEEPEQLVLRLSSERAGGSAPTPTAARSDDGRMAVTARPGAG